MLTNSPARTPSAMAIAIVSLVRLLCMKIGAESAQPSFNDLSRCRQPVRPIRPRLYDGPVHNPRPEDSGASKRKPANCGHLSPV